MKNGVCRIRCVWLIAVYVHVIIDFEHSFRHIEKSPTFKAAQTRYNPTIWGFVHRSNHDDLITKMSADTFFMPGPILSVV